MLALLPGGGNALGAHHGGCDGAAAVEPDWLAWSSIGAVTAALVAGSPQEQGTAVMKGFGLSQLGIERGWRQGRADLGVALRLWWDRSPFGRGLHIQVARASQATADA